MNANMYHPWFTVVHGGSSTGTSRLFRFGATRVQDRAPHSDAVDADRLYIHFAPNVGRPLCSITGVSVPEGTMHGNEYMGRIILGTCLSKQMENFYSFTCPSKSFPLSRIDLQREEL
jgi:hypothetical protein